MQELGKNIKLLRHEKGWSQSDFAAKLGISVPAFSKIENGLTDLHLSRLNNIAKILDMSIVELLSFQKSVRNNDANELDSAKESIKNYMEQILNLQKQVILLHEEIRKLSKAPKDVL
ncbi:helix-turn-helix domain protein [Mucilaginibacter paludis DSM 18603]|uniref:Helix-turn-helix domain protein n=2 Tax=Mucilaginibacter TaxID=423349 RepID=H1Y2D6_9SPHI|nr:helix-turn-helix domain protein [Mucilaginibacter paludis DSM 18603]